MLGSGLNPLPRGCGGLIEGANDFPAWDRRRRHLHGPGDRQRERKGLQDQDPLDARGRVGGHPQRTEGRGRPVRERPAGIPGRHGRDRARDHRGDQRDDRVRRREHGPHHHGRLPRHHRAAAQLPRAPLRHQAAGAAPDRPPSEAPRRHRADRLPGQDRGAARRGRGSPGGREAGRARGRVDCRLPAVLLPEPGPRAARARSDRRGPPRRAGDVVQRGAPAGPGVRAPEHDARQRLHPSEDRALPAQPERASGRRGLLRRAVRHALQWRHGRRRLRGRALRRAAAVRPGGRGRGRGRGVRAVGLSRRHHGRPRRHQLRRLPGQGLRAGERHRAVGQPLPRRDSDGGRAHRRRRRRLHRLDRRRQVRCAWARTARVPIPVPSATDAAVPSRR